MLFRLLLCCSVVAGYQKGDPIALYERVMFGNEVSSPLILAQHLLPTYGSDKTIFLHGFSASELFSRFAKAGEVNSKLPAQDFKLQLILGSDESARTSWLPVVTAGCFSRPPADTCRYLQSVDVVFTHEPHLTGAITNIHVRQTSANNATNAIALHYRWHTVPDADFVSGTSWLYAVAALASALLLTLAGSLSPSVAQGRMVVRASVPRV